MPFVPTDTSCDGELTAALKQLDQRGLRRTLLTLDPATGPRATLDGRSVVVMCSNDYLGLAADPRLAAAAKAGIDAHGFGSGASRLISGTRSPHRDLERAVAAFKGTEAALLFGSGYLANVGVISALVSQGDALFSDALNHASLIDGCRLSGATIHVYPHGDMGALSAKLRAARKARRRLIVSDGVFSMDGDLAPLQAMCTLAKAFDAWVLVDDAHGTGVIGPNGRGTAACLGVEADIDVHIGTFSKAFGGYGAFAAGSKTLIEYLVNYARTFVFTTAPPVAQISAAAAALEIVRTEPERRKRLTALAERLRRGLQQLGFHVPDGDTPIIPVIVGEATQATALSRALLDAGVFAQGIRPPTVPTGAARVRVTVTAAHSMDDVAAALHAFQTAGRRLGLI